MRFNKHSDLEGKHSFLSPSKSAWLRYDDQKMERMFVEHLKSLRGTQEHAFAAEAIRLGHKLPDEQKTLNMYINDSIGWRLKPEVELYWSEFAFGTADAIGFSVVNGEKILRVSDLKTGKSPTKMDQLIVYAALFCMEYEMKPWDLVIELRIYQSNGIEYLEADPDDVFRAMDRILTGTRLFEAILAENRF